MRVRMPWEKPEETVRPEPNPYTVDHLTGRKISTWGIDYDRSHPPSEWANDEEEES